MGKLFVGIVVVIVALIGIGVWAFGFPSPDRVPTENIASFEECVEAGYPVMESYPPQCATADGQTFTQDIGNEMELADQIRVNFPRPHATISSPLEITGEAVGGWYFEASFPVRLVDANGNTLLQHYAQAQGEWMTPEFVPFTSTLNFATPSTPTGFLILNNDNPSGLPENSRELRIPIRFDQNRPTMSVRVFWGNSNHQDTDCSVVESATRIVPRTEGTARAALTELLKGPTRQEQDLGYFSSIPQNAGVEIQDLRIENGTAYVDFNDELEYQVAGSCRVTHIRSQIEETLKQFPTVQNVVISIDGRTEDILQP